MSDETDTTPAGSRLLQNGVSISLERFQKFISDRTVGSANCPVCNTNDWVASLEDPFLQAKDIVSQNLWKPAHGGYGLLICSNCGYCRIHSLMPVILEYIEETFKNGGSV